MQSLDEEKGSTWNNEETKFLESPIGPGGEPAARGFGNLVRIKPRSKSGGRIEIEYYTSEDIKPDRE